MERHACDFLRSDFNTHSSEVLLASSNFFGRFTDFLLPMYIYDHLLSIISL